MPVVAVTDYVDPTGGGGDSDATTVLMIPRIEYRQFTLRYADGAFHHASSDGSIDPDTQQIKVENRGADYLVTYAYGMSEGNSWSFRSHGSCWYLSADPDAPTE